MIFAFPIEKKLITGFNWKFFFEKEFFKSDRIENGKKFWYLIFVMRGF